MLLPLLLVGRHGCQFTGNVAGVLVDSALAKTHPLLTGMEEVTSSEGRYWWEEFE